MADIQTGLNTCSCQCSPVLLSPLTRLPVMSNIFTSGDYSLGSQSTYMPGTADNAFFCSPLGAPGNNIRNSSDPWRPVTHNPMYDPSSVALYPCRPSYAGLDLNGRRKNATRESTNTLKAWLHEHLKNPYPTKGEKIMLAIITKMTLTQVSTWFANARRRLKKENRISGSPRHRSDNDREDELDDILVSGDQGKNNHQEQDVEEMDTTRTSSNYQADSAKPASSVPRTTSSDLPPNTHNVASTRSEPQTYITQSQAHEELDNGKRKIWSVIEFLNTTSHSDKDLLELDFEKSIKAKSGDILAKQAMSEKPGRYPARSDSHSSIRLNSCDSQSSIHNSYDNQSSKRQPPSSVARQGFSAHEAPSGYLQNDVFSRYRLLEERL